MKDNTRKILLLTYSSDSFRPFTVTYEHLKLFLPHLTGSGLRSLIVASKKQNLIEVERVVDQTFIRIAPPGRQAIESAFPVLQQAELQPQSTQGISWATLIFLKAPPGDKQFRYLRSLLVRYRAVCLSRGIYLYPLHFPPLLMEECRSRYSQSVIIGELAKWSIGDDRGIAIQHFQLLDLIQSYSGISSELERLIDKKKLFRDLNHQEKKHLSSLFDRLHANLQEDYGLGALYFPEIITGDKLLLQIQSLLK